VHGETIDRRERVSNGPLLPIKREC
jgi:hypothetical protein